ncbi:biopolymer transporter ExbD [Sulfurovum sp.]|uniref:ExbD/TolR family protein n=1 Tax=Sulfurovum sp. TaxID=1969726 RepID=UPI0025FBAFFA|nr:biopolymer transporter ExbD [Sulfurovum sp.]
MKRRESLTPDMTPLIDVVFILLIFFIVTSVFKKEELALLLNLPDSHAQVLEVEKENVTIELSEEKLALKGKEVTLDELEEELRAITDKKRAIIVRIDEEVRYKKIVSILDLLQKYELNNLSLVTRKK